MPCLIHIFAKSAFERRLKFQTWLRYQCKSASWPSSMEKRRTPKNFRSKLRTGWWIGFMSSLLLTSTGPRLDSKLSFVFTGLIIWTADSYGTSGFWSVSYLISAGAGSDKALSELILWLCFWTMRGDSSSAQHYAIAQRIDYRPLCAKGAIRHRSRIWKKEANATPVPPPVKPYENISYEN